MNASGYRKGAPSFPSFIFFSPALHSSSRSKSRRISPLLTRDSLYSFQFLLSTYSLPHRLISAMHAISIRIRIDANDKYSRYYGELSNTALDPEVGPLSSSAAGLVHQLSAVHRTI